MRYLERLRMLTHISGMFTPFPSDVPPRTFFYRNLEEQVESARHEIDHARHIRNTVESFRADSDALDAEHAAVEDLRKRLVDPEVKSNEDQVRYMERWRPQRKAEDGAPSTPPHGRSGSDGAAKLERPEVHGDTRGDERTTTNRKGAAGTEDSEASKLTRVPSSVMVEPMPETRLQRVWREPRSSPRLPLSNSAVMYRLKLPRSVDSSVFSEPLQESDMLRSPLPNPHAYRYPPRHLPPPISREYSAPLTAMRALPIPGRTTVTVPDDRSADARSGSLIDVSFAPANRTLPRSPVSPRSLWMSSVQRPDLAAAPNPMSSTDISCAISWGHGQGRDLIDFNKPPEQTIQDDNTLRNIQHLLDGQSSSEEATMVIKPSKTYVLPPIPPPPPLQTPVRNFGFVPPPPPLPKLPPVPIPVGPPQSNNTIFPSIPSTPDQDGSDSEAGTLWQKPMMEDDSLAERPKSTRGPPLTVKIGQFGGSPVQAKSSSSSGGMTLIPNKFPPPPKHPPPSPPLPQWGGRTPTRQLLKEQSKPEATFQDSSWASRPNPEEVLNRLEDFFPDHDLDKPVIEASSGGTSPTAPESPPAPLPYNGKAADKRSRHKKSIRVVAEEHNLRQDRTSRMQSSSAANVFRKRSTKLWDSRVEEVTPGQITSGMPSIPDSPSSSGTPAPKRLFLFTLALACAVAYLTPSQPSSNGFGVSLLGRAISVASTWR